MAIDHTLLLKWGGASYNLDTQNYIESKFQQKINHKKLMNQTLNLNEITYNDNKLYPKLLYQLRQKGSGGLWCQYDTLKSIKQQYFDNLKQGHSNALIVAKFLQSHKNDLFTVIQDYVTQNMVNI